MRFHGRTDIGKERSTNEDAFLILEYSPFYIFGVADGMGGHAAGEVASSLAFSSMRTFLNGNMAGLLDMDPVRGNFSTFIGNMISEANYLVWQAARENPQYNGMGTTITVLIIHANYYYIGHVGDSRAYMVQNHGIVQVTRDHSLVEEMVENGKLEKTQALNHPQRHVLTRALGTNPHVEVDFFHGNFSEGDFFILCTDGLTAFVGAEEILRVCRDAVAEEDIAANLVGMANKRGGLDNITVVVVQNNGT